MIKIILSFSMILFLLISANCQWSSDPNENTALSMASGEQAIPLVATSENGTTYIAWFSNESGNYDVRLQKLDVFGNFQWDSAGLLVSDHPAMSWLTDWDMAIDQEDHAILTFQDVRTGSNNIYAYRISPEGGFVWGDDGLALSNSTAFDAAPKVIVTNAGNIVIAWAPENEEIILQKISPAGTLLWGESGITLSGNNRFSWPQLLAVGDDDVILKFFEDSGQILYPTRHIVAQRYDANGDPVWDEVAVITDAGGISGFTRTFSFINDGQDGLYIAWHDDRDNNMLSSIFVQHIDADGNVVFADDGVEASLMAGRNNFYAHLALPPGSDEIFVFWNEMDGDQNNRGIYGQKISEAGERLWSDNGKSYIEISPTNVYPFSASGSETDMIVLYEEYSDVMNAGIKAMRIDAEGNYVWEDETVDMCTIQSEKVHTVANTFFNNQWIASWEDNRNGNRDIYAQNIQLDGSLGPVTITYELTLSHDTLFFNPGSSEEQIVALYNNSPDDFLLLNVEIDDEGDHVVWDQNVYLPYSLLAGDSLELNFIVVGEWKDISDSYDYYSVDIIGETDTISFVIAVVWGFVNTEAHLETNKVVNLFPIPAVNHVKFIMESVHPLNYEILIFDSFGKKINSLIPANKSEIRWNLTNYSNQKVPAGTYYYRLISEDHQETGKIILME